MGRMRVVAQATAAGERQVGLAERWAWRGEAGWALGLTVEEEAAYLEQWKQHALADECADNEQLMQMEHEEPHEEEDERRASRRREALGRRTPGPRRPAQAGRVAAASYGACGR